MVDGPTVGEGGMDDGGNGLDPTLISIDQRLSYFTITMERLMTAQDRMCLAVEQLSKISESAEERYRRMEDKLQEANDKAAGKAQIPLTSHFIILVSAVLIIFLGVLYVTKQTIKATVTSIEVEHGRE